MESSSKDTKDSEFQDSDMKKSKTSGWVVALVATISLARISHGLFISITGPTLLFLAENTNSDVTQVSAMFSGRSVGCLVGAACFSAVVNRFTKFQPLLSLGIGLGLNGVVMLITPFLTSLAGLVVVTTIGGLMFGYLDAGMQAVYLKLWGEEGSRPYIQSFHFGFSVGALLAPIIAAPFLAMANAEGDAGTTCPGDIDVFTTAVTHANETTTAIPPANINPISWAFVIIGVYTLLISIVLSGLALCHVENRVQTRHVVSTESRPEDSIKDLWVFFLPLCVYYFCCVSSEMVYQGYIYSVSLCSALRFTVSQANWLTTVFWTGFGIGRGSGIITSNFFKPSTIIIADLIGTTTIMTTMSIWGEQAPILTWIVTFIHGLCVATLYSSGVSWASQVTNMAGTYIFVFAVGGTLGAFSMMPAGGALFEQNPFSVMYLITGSCAANIVAFAMMNVVAGWMRRKKESMTSGELSDKTKGNSNLGFEDEHQTRTKL